MKTFHTVDSQLSFGATFARLNLNIRPIQGGKVYVVNLPSQEDFACRLVLASSY